MKIKFVDLDRQFEVLETELMRSISRMLRRQNFILGEEVTEFEEIFRDYIGCSYSVGVDSGTSALFLVILKQQLYRL